MPENKVFDVCIVGSGPAGAFAAHELSRKGLDVVVLEAGGTHVDPDATNVVDVNRVEISGLIDFGFSQQIGGSSNLWSGGLVRICPVDLRERRKFGFHGWPVKVDELDALYRRVDRFVGIQDSVAGQRRASGRLSQTSMDSVIESREMMVLETPFCTKALIDSAPGITLFDRCAAYQLNCSVDHKSVDSISVYNGKFRQEGQICARRYVIAAGALTNIRLLLHSFSEFQKEIPELYDNIGRYFSTHPKGNIGYLRLARPLEREHPFVFYKRFSGYASRCQFGLNEGCLIRHDLLNHCVRFNSPFYERLNLIFEGLKRLVGGMPFIRSGNSFIADAMAHIGVSLYRAIDSLGSLSLPRRNLSVRVFLDQAASPDNRVSLSEERSESGLPLGKVHWHYSEDDWQNVEEFVGLLSTELRRLDIGVLEYTRPTADEFTGIHSHFLGGTRIGESAGDSVVDENLKVHGFRNLFVSGPSVFPSFGYSNPFYTIAALSLRLADWLVGDGVDS